MNRTTLTLLATAALTAISARADTRVVVRFNVGAPACRTEEPAVVVVRPPVVVYTPSPANGYWKDVLVKTWVPERSVVSRDRWGRTVRVVEAGYTTYRTERVWVDRHTGNRFAENGRDNRGGYPYGNERVRRDWNR